MFDYSSKLNKASYCKVTTRRGSKWGIERNPSRNDINEDDLVLKAQSLGNDRNVDLDGEWEEIAKE